MNTNIIEKSLKVMLSMSSITDKEREDCIKALQEIACVRDVDDNADCWNYDAVLLPATAWDDILNQMTYDILGKLLKIHSGSVPLSYYVHAVRKELLGFDAVPACYLNYGYEIIKDLWNDNEAEGAHNPDGTFATVDDLARTHAPCQMCGSIVPLEEIHNMDGELVCDACMPEYTTTELHGENYCARVIPGSYVFIYRTGDDLDELVAHDSFEQYSGYDLIDGVAYYRCHPDTEIVSKIDKVLHDAGYDLPDDGE